MGNFASCVSPDMSKLSVKVVLPNGKMEEFRRVVMVKELMHEHPNHFVCHSFALVSMKKNSVLSGDTELEPGRLYYVLPNEKFQALLRPETGDVVANSKTPARSVNGIQCMAQAKFEIQHSENSSVTNVTVKGDDLSSLLSDVASAGRKPSPFVSFSTPDLRSLYASQMTMTRSNSWKPKLETIQEVVSMSRSKKQRVHNWEDSSSGTESPIQYPSVDSVTIPAFKRKGKIEKRTLSARKDKMIHQFHAFPSFRSSSVAVA